MSLPADVPSLRDLDWRWALPRIAVLFIVTRLLVLAVAVAVETTQVPPPEGIRADERPILGSLAAWDGTYYLGIAESGYHAEADPFPDYAFYPLYPIITKAVSIFTLGDVGIAAIIATNLAFLAALIVLYALSVRFLPPERSMLSLWYLALAPGAVAFSLVYSESLFLLLSVGAFLAAESKRPWLVGILYALAVLTRAPGILLGLPLLLLYLQRDGWRPTRSWWPLALGPLALALFAGYLWWLTGDPLASINAQAYWDLPPPVDTSAGAGALEPVPVEAGSTASAEAELVIAEAPSTILWFWIGTLLFYTFLFMYFRADRIRLPYVILAVLAIAAIFLSGRLQSAPRYLAIAWPFDWALANRASRIGRGAVLVGFGVTHVIALWLTFTWALAP